MEGGCDIPTHQAEYKPQSSMDTEQVSSEEDKEVDDQLQDHEQQQVYYVYNSYKSTPSPC